MEAEQQNGVPLSLTVPLMHDETQQEPSTVEASNGDQNTTGTTSFFKTCFNGLNALSGGAADGQTCPQVLPLLGCRRSPTHATAARSCGRFRGLRRPTRRNPNQLQSTEARDGELGRLGRDRENSARWQSELLEAACDRAGAGGRK